MKKILQILVKKWYLLLLVAACIITQCYLQLMLPEKMGEIQTYMNQYQSTLITQEELTQNILQTGGWMLLISAGVCILAVVQNFFGSWLGAYVGKIMRSEVFYKVNSLSLTNYNKFGTATLITRTTNDIEQIKNLVYMSIRTLIMSPTYMIIALIKILNNDSRLAIILAICIPLIIVGMAGLMAYATPLFKKIQEKTDNVTIVLRENLTGIRVIRAYNQQKTEFTKFDKANKDMTKIIIKVGHTMSLADPLINIIFNLCYVGIYALGFYLLDGFVITSAADMNVVSNTITNVAIVSQYSMQIMMSFLMFAMLFIMIPQASASSKRVNEVLKTVSAIKEKELTPEQLKKITNTKESGILEFKDVSFTYPDASQPVIEHISFKTKPGTTTAIIGSTGSGKSSIINLIPRFYDATSGSVCLDGNDIKDIPQKLLRDKIGFVPQTAVLFKGTIKENILFGKKDASDEEIAEALSVAQTEHFINKLPDKLNSYVSQGGKNFSGGQKQRLAIARALVRKPEVYVFDDSFSALDFKTDAKLRSALKTYAKDSAVVVVAQRVSSILDADNILVINDGKCVAQGTHNQLLKNCAIYRDIVKSQLDPDEVEKTLKMNKEAVLEGGK
ncbi:MAG: ABC transporter ATP-binding protein [Bacilli bacterium]|jgi:ATP-binding cassette, subfamily B, multidrug efflux pump